MPEIPHNALPPYTQPAMPVRKLSSAGASHSIFHGPTWTDGMVAPQLDLQHITLPKGVSAQELFQGELHPEAGHDDHVKADFAKAKAGHLAFLSSGRDAALASESTTHTVAQNLDGTTTVTLKRHMVSPQTLQDHYANLRDNGIPVSVATARTAAYAHNAAVRNMANLARLHPVLATAAAAAIVAMVTSALAAPPRPRPPHHRRHAD